MAIASQRLVDTVEKLARRGAWKNIGKILEKYHEADIAILLSKLPDSYQVQVWEQVEDLEERAEVLTETIPEVKERLLDAIDDDTLVEILELLPGDDAADIIEVLPDERSDRILRNWKTDEAAEVDTLLEYDSDTAGGIMSLDVFSMQEDTTVQQAIEMLQANHEDLEMAFYLYVVDARNKLVGVCSLRQLVVSTPDVRLADIMIHEVISVLVDQDQEDVARLVARYNILAIPVVDKDQVLVGVVTVDDIIDVFREEATEDLLKMAGADAAEFAQNASPFRSARLRMPWLLASFFGGIGAMFIIGRFEESLEQIAALAAFIPVTIGMGGNVGTQAATVITRGLALGHVNVSRFFSVVGKEIATGAMLGVVYGILLAVIAVLAYSNPADADWATWQLAATVSLSVCASMIISATVGGGVPLIFDRLGIDPAIATGPIITTSSDILGIAVYFAIGKAFLPI